MRNWLLNFGPAELFSLDVGAMGAALFFAVRPHIVERTIRNDSARHLALWHGLVSRNVTQAKPDIHYFNLRQSSI